MWEFVMLVVSDHVQPSSAYHIIRIHAQFIAKYCTGGSWVTIAQEQARCKHGMLMLIHHLPGCCLQLLVYKEMVLWMRSIRIPSPTKLIITTNNITQFHQHTLWIPQTLFFDEQRIRTSQACLPCLLHCQASHHRRTPKWQLSYQPLVVGTRRSLTTCKYSATHHTPTHITIPVQYSQQHQAQTMPTPPQYLFQTWAPLQPSVFPLQAG